MRTIATRVSLGIGAASPLIAIAMIIGVVAFQDGPTTLPVGQAVLISIACSIVLYGGSLVYFLFVVQKEDRLDSEAKTRWTLIMLMWFPLGAVAFWYQYIWRQPNPKDHSPSA